MEKTKAPFWTKKRKYIASALVGVGFCLSLGFGYGAWHLYKKMEATLPTEQGELTMPGLEAPVSIVRDRWGIPSVFASSRADAFRALGYLHASDRLFQMDLFRHAGAGRLSELAGPSKLQADKLVRTLGLYRRAEASLTALAPKTLALLQAYADGVNAWIKTHGDQWPPEYLMLGISPDPWTPADTMVWGKLMGLQLSKNMEAEAMRARLFAKVPREKVLSLFQGIGNDPVTSSPKRLSESKTEQGLRELAAATGLDHAASNAWVLSGKLTKSGKPILANDPHLGLEVPILWYLVRLVTPQGEVEGATVPGVPVFLLGQNGKVAWGFTSTGSDTQDLFIETPAKEDADSYVTEKGKEPFVTRQETILVRGRPSVKLTVRETRHGPVLSDIDPALAEIAGKGKLMSLAFSGLGEQDTTIQAFLNMNVAQNASDVYAAMKDYQTPQQNLFYADRKGHIGFVAPGLVPVRKKGDGWVPAEGASGDYDWRGYVPWKLLPHVEDPKAGYLFNANNAISEPIYAYWLGSDWEEPYRARRLYSLFKTMPKQDLETVAAMQMDHVSLAARELLPLLLGVEPEGKRAKEAWLSLKVWDGTMDRDKAEPLIFEAWLYEIGHFFFDEGLGDPLKPKGPLKAATLHRLLHDETGLWCKAEKPACASPIRRAFEKGIDLLSSYFGKDWKAWQWGEAHRATFRNKAFASVPWLSKRSDFSLPSSGDFYTLDRGGSFVMKEPDLFARTHGGGFRGLYDLSDPKASRFMIATGESGNLFSPHYRDLAEDWNEGKSLTLSGSLEDLLREGGKEFRLVPSL